MKIELVNVTPEIRTAIEALASFGSSPVVIRDVVMLETQDATMGALFELLLAKIVIPDQVEKPAAPAAQPEMTIRAGGREMLRACETCGELYQPIRKDQRYCGCNKKQKGKSEPVEVPTETIPLANQ